MIDEAGALIVVASVVLAGLFVAASVPAWGKPAVMFESIVAFGVAGIVLWTSHRLQSGSS